MAHDYITQILGHERGTLLHYSNLSGLRGMRRPGVPGRYRKCCPVFFAFPCKAGGGFGSKMKGGGKGRKGAFECLKPSVTSQGQVHA
jgi:hypothetical protein